MVLEFWRAQRGWDWCY